MENSSVPLIHFSSLKMETNHPWAKNKKTELIKLWNSLPKKKHFNSNSCSNSLNTSQRKINSGIPFEVHQLPGWKSKKAQHPTEKKTPLRNSLALCPNYNFHKKDTNQLRKSTSKIQQRLKIIPQPNTNAEKLRTTIK